MKTFFKYTELALYALLTMTGTAMFAINIIERHFGNALLGIALAIPFLFFTGKTIAQFIQDDNNRSNK